MKLRQIHLQQFRSHTDSVLVAASGVNVMVGPNGAGKTNVLEALGYLCLGKSFLSSRDQHVVQRGNNYFSVEGVFIDESGHDISVRLAFVPNEGKRAFINDAPLKRLTGLIGRIPLVVLSPADYDLTAGGPAERRRLLDTTLSQAFPVYLDDLVKYRRALRQKNSLLQRIRRDRSALLTSIDAWDEELARLGGRLMTRRAAFLERFAEFVAEAYDLLQAPGGLPKLAYAPSVALGSEAVEDLREGLMRTRRRSVDLGRTVVGPHLDEVEFRLDGYDLRPFASQGQHRTFALVVRIAEALYLQDRLDEPPILIMDDVFGTLDLERSAVILNLLSSQTLGQSFISAAREEPFRGVVPFEEPNHALFYVNQGALTSPPVTPVPPLQ